MKKLTRQGFNKAADFIKTKARFLENKMFSFYFENGSREEVLAELALFQNSDGGFNRIESDLYADFSTVLNACCALGMLLKLGITHNHKIVKKAIRYLLNEYNEESSSWPVIPEHDNKQPHAPWWHYTESFKSDWNDFLDFPRPEILVYLNHYKELVPADFLRGIKNKVLERLLNSPLDIFGRESAIPYIRLAESSVFQREEKVISRVLEIAEKNIQKDSLKWGAYCLKPIDAITSPGSLFFNSFKDTVFKSIDYEIEHQGEDGSWLPHWHWSGNFPEEWAKAKIRWQGVLTLKRLISFKNYGVL